MANNLRLRRAGAKQYFRKRDEGFWLVGTRVSLDSVVLAFWGGLSPETIVAECFPVLTLEQVYGAITYSLSHRDEINAYLKQADAEFEALRRTTNEPNKIPTE
ncbi:MAG: DUF433 domain-containing protein [bacterium]